MSIAALPPQGADEATAFFDALYGEHYRVVYAYLLGHVASADTAADLLQETFLRVWRHLDDARQIPCDRQRYWLFAIARNLTLDYRRRQEARQRCMEAVRESAVTRHESAAGRGDGDPAKALLARETAAAVDAAIAALPDDLRLVLTLHVMGGLTSAQIGKHLQRPAGTVRYQIARARQRIALQLNLDEPGDETGRKSKSGHE
jgi:RNA polymerase sigma-70 factor (ECF subfamily)